GRLRARPAASARPAESGADERDAAMPRRGGGRDRLGARIRRDQSLPHSAAVPRRGRQPRPGGRALEAGLLAVRCARRRRRHDAGARSPRLLVPASPEAEAAEGAARDRLRARVVAGVLDVMESIAEALQPIAGEITGLQIVPYLNTNPTPPSIDVYPGD